MDILRETASWIAVYKPAGLAVQTGKIGEPDLESEILNYLAEKDRQSGIVSSGRPPYLAVIHRLDQPVEGIVLFAKDRRAAAALSSALQQHRMEKEYLACVHLREGEADVPLSDRAGGSGDALEQQRRRLCDWLVRDGKTNLSRVAAAGTKGAKKADLEYRPVSVSGGMAVLEIRLLSGRHHQIRVQLAHAGMPIVGDRKYGDGYTTESRASDTCRFPALCARRLAFADPDGGEKVRLDVKPSHPLLAAVSGRQT